MRVSAAAKERKRIADKERRHAIKKDPEKLAKLREQQRGAAARYRERYPVKFAAAQAAWRVKNQRSYQLTRRFGISKADYEAMLLAQRGKCAICRRAERVIAPETEEPRALAVDHCHETGRVRGLLCYRCNVALGHLDHNEALLENAIDYLEKSRCAED